MIENTIKFSLKLCFQFSLFSYLPSKISSSSTFSKICSNLRSLTWYQSHYDTPCCCSTLKKSRRSIGKASLWLHRSSLLSRSLFLLLIQVMDESILSFFNKRVCQLTVEDNFQAWKQQVLLAVRGLNLEGYLFDTFHVPNMIDDGKGNKVINREYAKFTQQVAHLHQFHLQSVKDW